MSDLWHRIMHFGVSRQAAARGVWKEILGRVIEGVDEWVSGRVGELSQ